MAPVCRVGRSGFVVVGWLEDVVDIWFVVEQACGPGVGLDR